MHASGFIGLLGAIIALAALAIIVAKPAIVTNFFNGSSKLLGTAISPVTGR